MSLLAGGSGGCCLGPLLARPPDSAASRGRTALRPWSAEGVSGKNPVYHVGKLYNLAAAEAARRLHEETGLDCAVALVSQSGRDLTDPWQAIVQTSGPNPIGAGHVRQATAGVMADLRADCVR